MPVINIRKKEALNIKQRLFVEAYVTNGGNASAASRSAGYSEKNSSATARELMESRKIQEAIADFHEEIRRRTEFTLEIAMEEAEECWRFAREGGNAMAMLKATELRCKLSGLLIERHDVNVNRKVDLRDVLLAAEARLLPIVSERVPAILPDKSQSDSD